MSELTNTAGAIREIQNAINDLDERAEAIEASIGPSDEQQADIHRLYVRRQEVEIATMEFQLARDKAEYRKERSVESPEGEKQ